MKTKKIWEAQPPLNVDFRILHLADTDPEPAPYHYHAFPELLIFLGGRVQYFIEGRSYRLRPHDIVLVDRGELQRAHVTKGDPFDRILIHLSPAFLEAYQAQGFDPTLCFQAAKRAHSHVVRPQSPSKSPLAQALVRLEGSLLEEGPVGDLHSRILLLDFLLQLNESAAGNTLDFLDTVLCNQKVISLLEYIQEHLTENLDIDTLSGKLYLSKYHMMRLFKAETGFTIGSYINQKRLLLARDLLAQGASASDACLRCGFRDYSTFSRAYKKEFGLSPRDSLR